jgi:hypothetical protein
MVKLFETVFRFSASDFILRAQNKVTKQKGTPAAAYFLRFSLKRAAAELVLSALRQSSPKTPVLTAMLGAAKGMKTAHATSCFVEPILECSILQPNLRTSYYCVLLATTLLHSQ